MREINEAQKHTLYAKAYVEIYNIIKHNSLNQYTQNETLYLLILLTIFDKEYLLEEDVLMDYFFNGEEQQVSLNYFAITTLLFYTRNFKKYKNLKNKIFEEINTKFNYYNPSQIRRNTELVMLLLDLIKCPYIDIELKCELLEKFDIQDHSLQSQLIKLNKFWFIKWTNFDLIREIDWKKGFEVYS